MAVLTQVTYGPASCGKAAILLGMIAFLHLRIPNDGKAFLIY